ncbi:hypothetical protein [Lacrimispora brassicae]
MGSAGSGKFGNYRGSGAGSFYGDGSGGDGSGGDGSGGELKCPLSIENINLDDVGMCDYYQNYNKVPFVNEKIELSENLVNKRMVVVLSDTKKIIGNLPIHYNYLNLCLKKEMRYSGEIISSGLSPIPYIVVNLYA